PSPLKATSAAKDASEARIFSRSRSRESGSEVTPTGLTSARRFTSARSESCAGRITSMSSGSSACSAPHQADQGALEALQPFLDIRLVDYQTVREAHHVGTGLQHHQRLLLGGGQHLARLAQPGLAQLGTDQQTATADFREEAVLLAQLLQAGPEDLVTGLDAVQHFGGVDDLQQGVGHRAAQRVAAVGGAVHAHPE